MRSSACESAWQSAWQLNTRTGKKFDEIIDDIRPFIVPNAQLTGREESHE
jgi:hypothetical protein